VVAKDRVARLVVADPPAPRVGIVGLDRAPEQVVDARDAGGRVAPEPLGQDPVPAVVLGVPARELPPAQVERAALDDAAVLVEQLERPARALAAPVDAFGAAVDPAEVLVAGAASVEAD